MRWIIEASMHSFILKLSRVMSVFINIIIIFLRFWISNNAPPPLFWTLKAAIEYQLDLHLLGKDPTTHRYCRGAWCNTNRHHGRGKATRIGQCLSLSTSPIHSFPMSLNFEQEFYDPYVNVFVYINWNESHRPSCWFKNYSFISVSCYHPPFRCGRSIDKDNITWRRDRFCSGWKNLTVHKIITICPT